MNAHSVLGQVTLGYSPLVNRQRQVVATRLTVFPTRPDRVPDMQALLHVISEVWPATADDGAAAAVPSADAAPGGSRWPLALNIVGEGPLQAALAQPLPLHFMLEVPAFMAADAGHATGLRALHAAGNVLLIKGRPLAPLGDAMRACFAHSIVEAQDDQRNAAAAAAAAGEAGARQLTTIQAGVRNAADIEAAFGRGAVAVFGWPFGDAPVASTGRRATPTDVGLIMELISGIDRELPVARLEDMLKRDPTLAFRLLRHLNSPAFGLSVEVTSLAHALMLLGPQRLKRWLALLLASSSTHGQARPMLFAALRRGLLLEALVSAADAAERSELFICGIFSLLDRLLQQPMDSLLKSVPMPERVTQALCGQGGPYQPYLELACAIEQESVLDVRACAERLFLGPAEVNRALLSALSTARLLD